MNVSGAFIQITNNKSIVVDGCDSIIDFNDELIELRSGKLKISILGKKLNIKIFIDNTSVIEGIIQNVSFNYI